MASPTTTLGSNFVGHWDAVPAHYHNNNGARSYVPSGTAITSQPSRIEFVPIAGLRIQGWAFINNITNGDFWNFGNSTRKPPGGLVAAFYFPNDNDDVTNDINSVRCTARDIVEFGGTGTNGSGFVITLSRGTNTRGGTHATGIGGGNNISHNLVTPLRSPIGSVPLHLTNTFDPVTGYYVATGTPLSAGGATLRHSPAESLRWQCYYFSSINNASTWTSGDSIPPPKGMVTAGFMADVNSLAGDCVSVRVTSSNSIQFHTGGIGRNGWLLVGCRG